MKEMRDKMKRIFVCLICILMGTTVSAYASAKPPFYSGEFQVWQPEQFPCSLHKENPKDIQIFQDMQKTKRRLIEVEQRDIFFEERKMTCDSFVHTGILYVPVRQTAEFLGKDVEYIPDEKIILLKAGGNAERELPVSVTPAEKKLPAVKEITVDNIPIYYHSRDAELDAFKTRNSVDFSFSTFRCEGNLFMPLQTLTEAGGLVRIYEGTNVYLYDGDDFSHAEGIDTRFTVTGIGTSVKPDINEETVRRIAIKAANQFSEPGSVTYIATQNIQYYEKPAVLLVIGWETDYNYTGIPINELYRAYVYVVEE